MEADYTPKKNRKDFLHFIVIVVFYLTSSTNFYAQKEVQDKILTGKTFTIELVAQGGKKEAKPESDEISFKADKFTSKLMKTENEFSSAPYTVSESSGVITFEVESKNKSEDVLKWTGTITGEAVEGTAVWTTKKGKTKKEYNFTGSLKEKKKK